MTKHEKREIAKDFHENGKLAVLGAQFQTRESLIIAFLIYVNFYDIVKDCHCLLKF